MTSSNTYQRPLLTPAQIDQALLEKWGPILGAQEDHNDLAEGPLTPIAQEHWLKCATILETTERELVSMHTPPQQIIKQIAIRRRTLEVSCVNDN